MTEKKEKSKVQVWFATGTTYKEVKGILDPLEVKGFTIKTGDESELCFHIFM